MAYILDPTNDADNDGYAGINELAGTEVHDDVLDKNPLFRQAERFIIGLVPDADIRKSGRGTGRTYPDREEIIAALQFIAASYIIRGALQVGEDTVVQGSGKLKSKTRTIGSVTEIDSFDVGSSVSRSGGQEIGAADRATFLYESGLSILQGLGIDTSGVATDILADVGLTESKLPNENDYKAGGYYVGGFYRGRF